MAELKRSRHQLEAEARRLQEALARTERPRTVKVSTPASTVKPKTKPASNPCPNCGEPTRLVNLGRFEMWACPSCKWHAKKE